MRSNKRGLFSKWIPVAVAALSWFASAASAQTVSFAGAQTSLPAPVSSPMSLALDSAGNVYISDFTAGNVQKVTPGGVVSTVVSGLNEARGVAVDAKGNIYVGQFLSSTLLKVAPDGTQTQVGTGLNAPLGMTFDASGNLFIANEGGNNVVKVDPNGVTSVAVGGLYKPLDVAFDGAGDLYIGEGSGALIRVAPDGTQTSLYPGTFSWVSGITVDSAGDIFVSDRDHNEVWKIPVGGSPEVFADVTTPLAVRIDSNDSLFLIPFQASVQKYALRAPVFDTANVCPTGQTSPSPCSQSLALTYNVTASGTLGTPRALTKGAPNQDFSIASSTCSGAVTEGSTCTVNVTFEPLFPGVRNGAVQIMSNSGAILATTYVSGTATGPQVVFGNAVQSTLATLNGAAEIALDGFGNVYVAGGETQGQLVRFAPGSTSPVVVASVYFPIGVAADGAGNVYVSSVDGSVTKFFPDGQSASLPVTFTLPYGMAVDGAGSLYVVDSTANTLTKIDQNGNRSILASNLSEPMDVAVDSTGNIYIAEYSGNVVKLTPGGQQSTIGSGWSTPTSVSVDPAGDVYVTDAIKGKLVEVKPDGSQTQLVAMGYPYGVAVADNGDIYAAGLTSGVITIQRSRPPSFSFASTQVGNTSSDSPYFTTLESIGNTDLTGQINSISPGFTQASGNGEPADCETSFTIPAGSACNLGVSFTPTQSGNISGSVILLDNSLNSPSNQQRIQLSGTAVKGSQTLSFSGLPSTASYGSAGPYTLSATASSGLPVNYAVTGPASLSGTTLTINGVGTVYVTASQPGNSEYDAAASVTQSITITQGTATVTLTNLSATYTGSPIAVTATTNPAGLTVNLTYNGSAAAPKAVGTYAVVATVNDTNYQGSATGTLVIGKATATITLSNLTATYNGSANAVTATTNPAGLTINLTYNGSATAPTTAGSYAVVATVSDSNYQGSATGTLVISKGTPAITWPAPAPIVYGTALSTTQLNASSSVAGALIYSPGAGSVLNAGSQILSVIFTPSDAADYSSATATVALIVNQAGQTITFNPIPSQVAGNSIFLSAASTSGLAVSYASSTPTVCSVSGSSATMLSAGTCTIQASQPGSANYAAAVPVSQSFTVAMPSSFRLTATPGSETIKRGNLSAFLLEATSINGFSGSVKITCSGGPANSVCGDFPQTLKLVPNGTALALSGVLFPKSTAAGTYTVTFTGTSGTLTNSVSATFTLQ